MRCLRCGAGNEWIAGDKEKRMPRKGVSVGSPKGEKPRVVKAGTSPRGTSFGKGEKITKGKGG